jgi:membrane fusion protein (multidrug efflux system)
VTEGLKDGDRVIVTGLQKVRPGVQVKAQEVLLTINSKPQPLASQNKPSLNLNRSR